MNTRRWRWRSGAARWRRRRRSSARCSTTGTAPSETASSLEAARAWAGHRMLELEERTNYPLTLSVDDLGEGFVLTAQVVSADRSGSNLRVTCGRRWRRLVEALETAPETAVESH